MKKNDNKLLIGNELISLKDLMTGNHGAYSFNILYNMRRVANFLSHIFITENVPQTIDPVFFELSLMYNGTICALEKNSKKIVATGSYCGNINDYGIGDSYTFTTMSGNVSGEKKIANLNDNSELISDNTTTHLIVCRNDKLFTSMTPFIIKYGTLLAEAETTARVRLIQARMQSSVIAVKDSNEQSNVDSAIKSVIDGVPATVIRNINVGQHADPFDTFNLINTDNVKDNLSDVLLAQEEVLNMMVRELGISLNTKAKKSQVNTVEFSGYERYSQVWINDMLEQRKIFWDAFNIFFGENVTVKINPLFVNDNENDNDESEE